MSDRLCKVHDEWLSRQDSSGHIIQEWAVKKSEYEIFCHLCQILISCKSKGFQSISQHVSTKNHSRNINAKLCPLQLTLKTNTNNNAPLIKSNGNKPFFSFGSNAKDVTRAEIVWCLKVVQSNFSASSCDNIAEVFKAMFPAHYAAENFQMGRTKCGYFITEGIGPYFRKLFLEDVGNEYFCLMYDETVNNEKEKELQILIRYYSNSQNKVLTNHLETFFISYATADVIAAFLKKGMDNANLSLTKLIALSSDNEEIKVVRGWGLADIGTCNIHMIHNAFLKGLQEFGADVSDLIISIYSYFDGYPVRAEDYSKIQEKHNIPKHRFIKHIVPSRWLTLLSAAESLKEQWPTVLDYFLKYVPTKKADTIKSNTYISINKLLKQKDMKCQIYFVIESALIFTNFTKYQRNEPLIHTLHDHLHELIILIGSRISKRSNSRAVTEIFKEENLVDTMKVFVSDDISSELIKYSEKDKMIFLNSVKKHYKVSGKYIVDKMSMASDLLQNMNFLKPTVIKKEKGLHKVRNILRNHIKFDSVQISNAVLLLQAENLPEYNEETDRIDEYWSRILNARDNSGFNLYFKNFIKCCLCLSHGNAEVERGFSRSKLILDYDKTAMNARTLNARLNAIGGLLKLQNNRADHILITEDLIAQCRLARKSYLLYLEREKKEKEEKIGEQQTVAAEKETAEQIQVEFVRNKNLYSDLNIKCEEERKNKELKKQAADGLLGDINRKLQKAIKDNSMVGLQTVQTLMDGALSLRNQEQQAEENIGRIEKRKSTLITQYLYKKPKK